MSRKKPKKATWEGPQSEQQVIRTIAHLMKSLWICLDCSHTAYGRDIRLSADSPVEFQGDGITPKFRCPKCNSQNFELLDAPPDGV